MNDASPDFGVPLPQAQGIALPMTTSMKLRGSDHRLFLVKEPGLNGGKGAVVGLAKVGAKRLFVTVRVAWQPGVALHASAVDGSPCPVVRRTTPIS